MTKLRQIWEERLQLIRAREQMGLTRIQFAHKIGASRSNVYRIETGVSNPSLALMQRWLLALGPDARMEWFWAPSAKARPGPGPHDADRDAAA